MKNAIKKLFNKRKYVLTVDFDGEARERRMYETEQGIKYCNAVGNRFLILEEDGTVKDSYVSKWYPINF